MMPSGDLLVCHLTVDAAPVRALAALFDDGLPVPGVGDELPALWHWAALARWPGAQATGPDGHPATGGFLPDVGKPRRMFAGGSVTLHGPLVVGTEVRREERVLAVTPKTGRQGDFVLVQVESRIFDERDVLALVEVQDLVYRDARTAEPAPTTGDAGLRELAPALLAEVDGTWVFQTDPSRLMRFSSATSNGHRIHYDQPYAVNVEGYPGLVVHGPLMTIALAQVVRWTACEAPRVLTHRNLRPLLCGQAATVSFDGSAQPASECALQLVCDEAARASLRVTTG
jgi:3-methylfumaryl-CoA hydratase